MAKKKRLIVVRFRDDRQRWEVDHRDADGRRHRPLFDTEEEALKFAAKVSNELASGAPVIPERDILLKDYVEKWKPIKVHEVEARTFARHVYSLDRYVLPAFGHFRVREIRRRHVKALVIGMKQKGYAPDTIRLARAALSSVLSCAVDDEIVEANVTFRLGMKLFRGQPVMHPTTREVLDAFLTEAHKAPPYGTLFEVMAKAGGARPSEAMALKPGEVDWRTETLRIERALGPDGTVKATKTHETREVDLPRAWLPPSAATCGGSRRRPFGEAGASPNGSFRTRGAGRSMTPRCAWCSGGSSRLRSSPITGPMISDTRLRRSSSRRARPSST